MTTWKKLHPIVWTIIIGTMFARLATSMSIPFLTIYLTKTLGASPFEAAFIVGLTALVGIFTGFIGGNFSDQFGKKTIILISVFFFVFVFIGYSLATKVWMFFILSSLSGIARSLFEPSSRALLSEVTKQEYKLMMYNLRYAAANLGVVVGPLFGVLIGSTQSTESFLVPAVIYFVYGIFLSIVLHLTHYSHHETTITTPTVVEAFHVVKNDRVLSLAISAMILCTVAYSQFMSTMPQYFSNSSGIKNGVELYAGLLTLNAITVVLLQYPLTRIGKMYSPLTSIIIGGAVMSCSLMLLGISGTTITFVLSIIFFTVGEVLIFSMTDVLIDELAPSYLRGTYFGAMGFSAIGQIIGPWIGGALLNYFGYASGATTFLIVGCISIFSVPLFIAAKHHLRKRKEIEV